MTAERFPELWQFFAGNFHQDWGLDYATAEEAVAAFIAASPSESLAATLRELEALLAVGLSERDLADLVNHVFAPNYDPAYWGSTYREWLACIRLQLQAGLAEREA